MEQTFDLMSERQASEFMSISPSTLQRLRKTRSGPPFIKVGEKLFKYNKPSLLSWLTSLEEASKQ